MSSIWSVSKNLFNFFDSHCLFVGNAVLSILGNLVFFLGKTRQDVTTFLAIQLKILNRVLKNISLKFSCYLILIQLSQQITLIWGYHSCYKQSQY